MEQQGGPIPKQRKKIRHFDEPGDARFLTFSCYRRMPVLNKDRLKIDRTLFTLVEDLD